VVAEEAPIIEVTKSSSMEKLESEDEGRAFIRRPKKHRRL